MPPPPPPLLDCGDPDTEDPGEDCASSLEWDGDWVGVRWVGGWPDGEEEGEPNGLLLPTRGGVTNSLVSPLRGLAPLPLPPVPVPGVALGGVDVDATG